MTTNCPNCRNKAPNLLDTYPQFNGDTEHQYDCDVCGADWYRVEKPGGDVEITHLYTYGYED